MNGRPNPGSSEAIAQGCTCPVVDNNRGKVAPWPHPPDGYWWISGDCPVHVDRDGNEGAPLEVGT